MNWSWSPFYSGGELIKLLRSNNYNTKDIFDNYDETLDRNRDIKVKSKLSYMECEYYNRTREDDPFTRCFIKNADNFFKDIGSLGNVDPNEFIKIDLYKLYLEALHTFKSLLRDKKWIKSMPIDRQNYIKDFFVNKFKTFTIKEKEYKENVQRVEDENKQYLAGRKAYWAEGIDYLMLNS